MRKDPGPDTPRDPRLEKLLADYLDRPRGTPTGIDIPTEADPEYDGALREFADNCDWMRRLAGPAPDAEATGPPHDALDEADAEISASSTIDAARYVRWQPHARGGLGEVFTAYDRELNRVVALKRIRDDQAGDARSQRHFLVEAEVTARLDHPGVVPVHSLFRDQADRPCYTMRFIEGRTLDDALKEYHAGPPEPVAFRRLLQGFLHVCETMAYAHSRGVLHRDLKPQNVMLGKFGETIVVDWGLAKVVGRPDHDESPDAEETLRLVSDSSLDRTAMGDAVGTPAYMSPEQAAGRWDVIHAASDVYNLGAMLYAILTGRPPLQGANWPEMQQKIQRGDFPRPRVVNPSTPRALEAICVRAMSLAPEDRYPSARELADDVERWLAGEPVAAYREPVADRLRRWARRHRVLVANGSFAAVGAIVLASIVGMERMRARAAEDHRIHHAGMNMANARVLSQTLSKHQRLIAAASAVPDRFGAELARDPRWGGPESRELRGRLGRHALEFWDQLIRLDAGPDGEAGPRTRLYLRRRALSLARFGAPERAEAEVKALLATPRPGENAGMLAYDLARIYAICAASAHDDAPLAEAYAVRAVEFLKEADGARYFAHVTLPEPLDVDLDFTALRARADFREFCDSLRTR